MWLIRLLAHAKFKRIFWGKKYSLNQFIYAWKILVSKLILYLLLGKQVKCEEIKKNPQHASDGRYLGVFVLKYCIWRGQTLIGDMGWAGALSLPSKFLWNVLLSMFSLWLFYTYYKLCLRALELSVYVSSFKFYFAGELLQPSVFICVMLFHIQKINTHKSSPVYTMR